LRRDGEELLFTRRRGLGAFDRSALARARIEPCVERGARLWSALELRGALRSSALFPSFPMKTLFLLSSLFVLSLTVGCARRDTGPDPLVGAWRGGVQFTTGAFATTKDLAFMYVFQAGGTMTESSNYDSSPPVPPAYGAWRRVGDRTYEAKYAYFWTKPPTALDEITKGNGWSPGGHGLLAQKITLSADGQSFDSTITYNVFDQAGKPTEKESVATAKATRIGF
jgi:hypothetical protein